MMSFNIKAAVFCVVVVASVSNNGKASLNDLASSSNALFEDKTKYEDRSCYRPCKFNVKPRRCHFTFKVAPTITDEGSYISINGIVPGPPIHVCANDIIVVEVLNKIPDEDLAIHWHGIDQLGTPYMDGVPMITQCPINYGSTYKYTFRASNPGTYFYHAHSVSHQTDGVFGALIVNQPSPLDANSPLYDYDRSKENTLVISAAFPKLFTGNLDDLSVISPMSLKINGKEDVHKMFVNEGFAYRLRLINAAVICPISLHVSNHELLAIASDGRSVKPVSGTTVTLYPGERMDVVIRADQKPQGYWLYVDGGGSCKGLRSRAMLVYSGFNYTSMLLDDVIMEQVSDADSIASIKGQNLESLRDMPYSSDVRTVYLGIKRNTVQFKESDNDFRYIADAIPKKPFFPAQLSLRKNGVVQINGKSFLYPNAPLLTQSRDVKVKSLCEVGTKHDETQCIQILTVPLNSAIELALVNEDEVKREPYVFHLHGYGMHVLSTSVFDEDDVIVNEETFNRLEENGKIIRNTLHPPIKDTVVVPSKGFTVVRVKLDHAGIWLLECRSCGLSSLPTSILINVPQTLPKSVLDSLPKCGNYRPPDVLLN